MLHTSHQETFNQVAALHGAEAAAQYAANSPLANTQQGTFGPTGETTDARPWEAFSLQAKDNRVDPQRAYVEQQQRAAIERQKQQVEAQKAAVERQRYEIEWRQQDIARRRGTGRIALLQIIRRPASRTPQQGVGR